MDIDLFLERELYPALFDNLDIAFPEFEWVRKGKGWQAKNEQYCKGVLGHHAATVVCNKPYGWMAHGQRAMRWLEYQANGRSLTGDAFKLVIKELCDKANIKFPEREYSPQQAAAYQARIRRTALLDNLWEITRSIKHPLKVSYMQSRKIVETAELGFIANIGEVVDQLKELEYEESELIEIGLVSAKGFPVGYWNNRLMAYVTSGGAIKGLLGRRLVEGSDQDHGPKYLYTRNLPWSEIGLSNLDRVGDEIVITEGGLEPTIFNAEGYRVFCAAGGSGDKLTKELWELLAKRGVTKANLFLDTDEAGQKGLEKAFAAYDLAERRPSLYVVRGVSGCKDPDEIRQRYGIERVKKAVSGAEHHLQVRVEEAIERFQLGEGDHKAEAELFALYVNLATKYPKFEREKYLDKPMMSVLGVSAEALEEAIHAKHAEEADRRQAQILANAKSELGQVGDIHAAADVARQILLGAQGSSAGFVPPRLLSDAASGYESWLEQAQGQEFLGLPNRTLPTLDRNMLGLRGVILVPGPPNVGKSAFCHQLGIDCVKARHDVGYIYLALEMSNEDHYARMLMMFSGLSYEKIRLGPRTEQEEAALERARIDVVKYGTRVLLLDKKNFAGDITADAILEHKKWLKAQTGVKKVVLVIDYLQRMVVPSTVRKELKSDLEIDDWRMEQIELLKEDDEPIFVISQQTKSDALGSFGKLAGAKGSSSAVYTPDSVWFLRPAADEELWPFFKGDDLIPEKKGELIMKLEEPRRQMAQACIAYLYIDIQKGRDGMKKSSIPVTFNYRSDSFSEGWVEMFAPTTKEVLPHERPRQLYAPLDLKSQPSSGATT